MNELPTAIPAYPAEIQPQPQFVPAIDTGLLLDAVPGVLIQRRSTEEADTPLSPASFGNPLYQMSVNLMGGLFIPGHEAWVPKKIDISGNWNGDYEFRPKASGIYMAVSNIHEKHFPASRSFNSSTDFDKMKSAIAEIVSSFSRENIYQVRYRVEVDHVPTGANYWHCQIETLPDTKVSSQPIVKDKALWQKEVFRSLVNYLIPFAKREKPASIPAIPLSLYIKKKDCAK